MKTVKLKSLLAGMVTANEIKDRMGRVLLASDHTITEKNLKTLKAWGVTEVNIQSSNASQKDAPKQEETVLKASPAMTKKHDNLFKYTDRRHPAIAELYNVCLARKIQEQLDVS